MTKPTSLAAQLKRDDEAEQLARNKEDLALQGKVAAPGKVWVRLSRHHYASENVMHPPGITQLNADAVPASAKVLSTVEAAEAAKEPDDE